MNDKIAYKITHVQAVWETSQWKVEASSEEEAEELLEDGMAELVWKQIGDSVESIDTEVTIEGGSMTRFVAS